MITDTQDFWALGDDIMTSEPWDFNRAAVMESEEDRDGVAEELPWALTHEGVDITSPEGQRRYIDLVAKLHLEHQRVVRAAWAGAVPCK